MFAILTSGNLAYAPMFEVEEELIVDTPYGKPSSPVWIGHIGTQKLAYLSRHGVDHTIPPHLINYRANIWALSTLNINGIMALSPVVAVSNNVAKDALVLPTDFIDYTYDRQHTFCTSNNGEVKYVNMQTPFDEGVRMILFAMALGRGVQIHDGGVYGCVQGPRLPTKIEAERYRKDGCDIIGMTGMPEAALARELSIPFAILGNVVGKLGMDSDADNRADFYDYIKHESFLKIHQMITDV